MSDVEQEVQEELSQTPARRGGVLYGVLALLVVAGLAAGAWFYVGGAAGDSTVVAMVNGEEVLESDVQLNVSQQSQALAAQGADLTAPEVQEALRQQAVEALVNATLLKQEAAAAGYVPTEAEVTARISAMTEAIGGQEALAARMAEFNVTEAELREDVQAEIAIETLLTGELAANPIDVTEAEISSLYETVVAGQADAPALVEVRDQVVAQIRQTKEQDIVFGYIESLKAAADIQVNE